MGNPVSCAKRPPTSQSTDVLLVETAADGREGFDKASDHPFDLIILDVMLPRRNGLDVCRDIRAAGNSSLATGSGRLTQAEELADELHRQGEGRDRPAAQTYFFKPAVQFTTTLTAWVDSTMSAFTITRPSAATSHASP